MAELNTRLSLLVDEAGFSEPQEKLVKIFQSVFAVLSEEPLATLDGEAERAASELCALVPPEISAETEEKPSRELLGHFEEVWHALLDIATRVPHQDSRSQTIMAKTLQVLGGGSPVWKDLPNLGNIIRDKWIDPTFEWHPDDDDNYTLGQWLNLNSFVARPFGSGVIVWQNFPIWQLRKGLEDDLAQAKGDCSPAEAIDNRVAVASEWLIHAGPVLLKLCLLDHLDEDLRKSTRVGIHFSGHPGFNLERWGFWKRRLEGLRSTVSIEVAPSVERAIKSMRASAVVLAGN
ncbi:hypothetical protein B0T14DRAFT_314731 [Immersiella caudata]|uniref:Uncharacterized protein n=1 Tax=Immersiella caudata TaxID=314043 RepID=A0AA39U4M5_9PEZI|nr:hypothetical protein B0T14DRAFT_314731 [Immersiella caudata]